MKKGNRNIAAILFCIMMIGACVSDPQDIPGNMTSDPVFRMTGTLDGQPFEIEAGNDGWTMQPFFDHGALLPSYVSVFSKHGCLQDCSPSFGFRFYKSSGAQSNPMADFQKTIKAGQKDFVASPLERDSFQVSLNTHPDLFVNGFSSWNHTGGTSFQPEYFELIGPSGKLDVCFQSFSYTGCQYSQCIYFDPSTLAPCLSYIEPRLENDRYVSLALRPQGTPPFKIEWKNMDSLHFNNPSSSTIIIPLSADVVDIYANVVVTDAFDNRSELNQTIRVRHGNIDPCFFPIDLSSMVVNSNSPADFEDRVEIFYTDEQGILWSSTAGLQDQGAGIAITEISYFDRSPMDQSAYKVIMQISGRLYNQNGESKYFSAQNAVIALSHP